MGKWELLDKESVFKDHWKSLEKWSMRNANGNINDFTIVISRSVVVVFGITPDNEVLVTREYFMSQGKKMIGMVAGMVEQENIKQVAVDELRQESGYAAEEMIYLGNNNYGKYTTGTIHYFLAKNIKKVGPQELEDNEDIDVELVTLAKFKKMLKANEMESVLEMACAYKALDYLGKL